MPSTNGKRISLNLLRFDKLCKSIHHSIFINPERLCNTKLIPVMSVLAPVSSILSLMSYLHVWYHSYVLHPLTSRFSLWRHDSSHLSTDFPRRLVQNLTSVSSCFSKGTLSLAVVPKRQSNPRRKRRRGGRQTKLTRNKVKIIYFLLLFTVYSFALPSPLCLSPPFPLPHLRPEQCYFTPLWSPL